MKSATAWPVLVSQILIFFTVKGMVMEKLYRVSYLDQGTYITEYVYGETIMQARGHIIHSLKRWVDFQEVVEVSEVGA